MKRLVIASTNLAKVGEVAAALEDLADWTVAPLPPGLPEIAETGSDYSENAVLKALHYGRLVEGFALADDSGLSVAALNGRPGVHSARYAPTAEMRNQRLLAELRAAGPVQRAATFHCAFAVARSGEIIWSIQSSLHGSITTEPAGKFGFGYDSVFFVPGLQKTLAELTLDEKNRVSARGMALSQLREFLSLQ